MEYLSSMYIDDEMNPDEKKIFIEKIRTDQAFYELTNELLEQEKLLQMSINIPQSMDSNKWQIPFWFRVALYLKPAAFVATGFAAALLVFFFIVQPQAEPSFTNRFIIFQPEAGMVELAGTFTNWERIPMKQIGRSGYWELIMPVTSGEHRFAYILDNKQQVADPTMLDREKDDFGGENSILNVKNRI